MRLKAIPAVLFTAASLASAASAQTVYEFTKIADTSGSLKSLSFQPAINNQGQVAFHANRLADECIYRGDGVSLTEIAKTGGGTFIKFLGVWPSINDAGVVAFEAAYAPSGKGIHVGDGSTTTQLAQTSDVYPDISDMPVISNSGRVVYGIKYSSGDWAIRSSKVGASTIEYAKENSGGFSGLTPTMPSINSNDEVVFRGYRGSPIQNGIHVDTGPTTVTVTDGMGLINDFGNAPDINSSGQVVFLGGVDGTPGSFSLYVGGVGETPVLAASKDVYSSSSFSTAEINNNGKIAFTAQVTATGAHGIFTGNDPAQDRVAMLGDPLEGSTITGILMGRNGLNDQGQVAFWAELADGRQGIFVATPVPEPSAMLMLGLGSLTALALFQRQRRIGRRPAPRPQ